jgi:hypothetical protein
MCLVLLVVGFVGGVCGGEPADEDPWVGKSREDVVTFLGEPNKTKDAGDGGEILIYKFVRLREGDIAPMGMAVLNVPGIGLVGRMPGPAAMKLDTVIEDPGTTNRRGRPAEGGLGEDEKLSVSYDADSGELERSWEERTVPSGGKATLKLHLDASGKVVSWTVSPKKARSDS